MHYPNPDFPVDCHAIQAGSLVRSRLNTLAVGKVISISNSNAIVEYFLSVGSRIEKTIPIHSLERVTLERHTRCYFRLEDQENWQIGRIYQWHGDDRRYEIDLPNGKYCYATESEIYVRCDRPIADPTEILIMKGQETPFFHDRRSAFIRCLVEQRAISRGMPGLFSANIELYRHQVEVARRVLEDPIQRYLLADEVGLGKTIEAGIIVRQYLLDHPASRALVIAPRSLLKQWQQELSTKFYLTDRAELLALEDLATKRTVDRPNFLIIDEAQHIAAMATSSDRLKNQYFEICRRLAHGAEGLLLLSATPALNHEQAFLAMLHLLDPETYQLDDLKGFKERVRLRQEIGRVLLSFTETASPFVLKMSLSKLRDIFSTDVRIQALTDQFKTLLGSPESDLAEQKRLIRAIRTHISDTYRLHRRMLRNRRVTVEDVLWNQSNAGLTVEYDEDERSPTVHEYLDEWRTRAMGEIGTAENSYGQLLCQVFLTLFQAGGTWLNVLQWTVKSRLNQIAIPELFQEFSVPDVDRLVQTPLFSGEAEILENLLDALNQPSEFGDRIDQLQAVIEQLRRRSAKHSFKVVVFTRSTHACQEIVRRLTQARSSDAIATFQIGQSAETVEENTAKFRDQSNCCVLVCDASGEEGHNLQFATYAIHFDLPWSPNRLEQRNGRLNRIGQRQTINSIVFAGADVTDSLYDAQFQCLKEGFKVFRESIASLQFYVDRKLPELQNELFQSGAYGLTQSIPTIQAEISAEQISIDEQNALDEIDALEEGAAEYFQALDDYDAKHQAIQEAVEGWVCEALLFDRQWQAQDISSYKPSRNRRPTLVPTRDLLDIFSSALHQAGTYNRRIALQNLGSSLYRIGDDLIEAFSRHARWDDRGQAFALWRHEPTWSPDEGMEWIGFRFDYVVEADLTEISQICGFDRWRIANQAALSRRADALFPPVVETVFLDTRMNIVNDAHLLSILQRPFSKHRRPTHDYNLAKERLEILDEYISRDAWDMLCRRAREQSESRLRDRPDFVDRCRRHVTEAERQLSNRLEQLQLRLERQKQGGIDSALAQEVEIEQALAKLMTDGIASPKIRLDSIGFYIVSGRSPSPTADEESSL